jgi:hypothetical protein
MGRWTPRVVNPSLFGLLLGAKRSMGSEALLLRPEKCELSSSFAQRFIDCDQAPLASTGAQTDSCQWRIEGTTVGEALTVAFRGPDGDWRRTQFGVYRQKNSGEIALLTTCGSGHPYGLFRQPEHSP